MAFREVGMLEIKEVLRLWLSGKGKKGIALQLELDRNTVRRYLRAAIKSGLSQNAGEASLTEEGLAAVLVALKAPLAEPIRGESWMRCETQRAFIEKHLKNRVQLSKVHRLLKRQGVTVPYATLHRYALKELDFGPGLLTSQQNRTRLVKELHEIVRRRTRQASKRRQNGRPPH